MTQRVYCTGISAVTCLGLEAETLATAMQDGSRGWVDEADGTPGVRTPLTYRSVRHLPGVKDIRPGTMTAPTLLAVGASGLAMHDSGMERPLDEASANERIYQVGTATNVPDLGRHLRLVHHLREPGSAQEGTYTLDDTRLGEGMKGFTGFEFLKLMNNMPGAHGGIQSGSRGPCNTFLGPATSGMKALGRAFRSLRDGRKSVAIAGGVGDGGSPHRWVLHEKAGRLSPARVVRPLDEAGRGLVPADGAGMLVLETAASVEARAVAPRAEILGFGTSLVPDSPAVALEESLRGALDEASVGPGELACVVGSGMGASQVDRWEVDGLTAVLGEDLSGAQLILPSALVGWTEAAAGPLGVIAGILALQAGTVGPTWYCDHPLSPLKGVRRDGVSPLEGNTGVASVLTAGGSSASIVFRVGS